MLFVAVRRRLLAMLLVAAIPRTAVASAPATTPPARCYANPVVPANLIIGNEFIRSLVSEMSRRSPTFRAQLTTIGSTQRLLTRLRNMHMPTIGQALAQTTFGRSAAGYLVADIDLSTGLQPRQSIEYIAHELEHVLEQIEGIDLPSLARTPRSGVRSVEAYNAAGFETQRAQSAGIAVHREYFFGIQQSGRCVRGAPDTAD